MSTNKYKDFKLPGNAKENPFSVPEDYFNTFSSSLAKRMKFEEESEIRPTVTLWKRVRPHLALAAVIAGFALISLTALQLILGEKSNSDSYYNLGFLDEAGILNESTFQETIADIENDDYDSYSEWEEDAMTYLASNEVNLDALLYEN